MRILSVVGNRPQFVKSAPLSLALRERGVNEIVLHTGQHYDPELSAVFFDELELPPPAYRLETGSGTHGEQTGRMLPGIEAAVVEEQPDAVLVYGDTNSTLAGALAAGKLLVPVAHVEAGLRSFDRSMPEELNRMLVDRLSNLLFCPTDVAVANLAAEGITEGIHQVGDVMYDANLRLAPLARERSKSLERAGVEPGRYLALTLHREANVQPEPLRRIASALEEIGEPVVFPAHPERPPPLRRRVSPSPRPCAFSHPSATSTSRRSLPGPGDPDRLGGRAEGGVLVPRPVRDAQDDDRVGGDARDRLEPARGQRTGVDRHGHPQCGSRPRAPDALRGRTGLGEDR